MNTIEDLFSPATNLRRIIVSRVLFDLDPHDLYLDDCDVSTFWACDYYAANVAARLACSAFERGILQRWFARESVDERERLDALELFADLAMLSGEHGERLLGHVEAVLSRMHAHDMWDTMVRRAEQTEAEALGVVADRVCTRDDSVAGLKARKFDLAQMTPVASESMSAAADRARLVGKGGGQ